MRRKLLGRDLARSWEHREGTPVAEPRRTRVLIEDADGADAFSYWRLLTDNGYEAQWCPGPENHAGGRCPLVTSGRCELVEDADVVVSALGIDNEASRKIVGAIKAEYPETPLVVQGSRREFTRWADLVEGSHPLPTPVTARALLGTVEDALAHRE
ncbi:MAG TPA: hypothetical protein VN796_00130 [Acidimicrobiales bacterium]|nr:hypothetical protein [Acidimicrobiales bacterium]